jgi:ABC-2 type transport system permease protein
MRPHRKSIRFAAALLVTNLKASLMLRGAFAMQVVFMAVNNFTFFVFWWVLMRRVPEIRGWRLADIEVLFGIVAVAVGLAVTMAGGVRYLGQFIEQGELDTLLVQPPPVLLHAAGMRSQSSGFGDILSGLLLIAWSGQVAWIDVPRVAVAAVAAALVFAASGILFFSLAFWLGKSDTVARQMWELVITFSLYPEPLFGGVLRLVLFTVIPAGWVGYVPARLAQHASPGQLLLLATAAAGYLALAVVTFQRGLRQYASGSRFEVFG